MAAPDSVQIAPANGEPGFDGRNIYEAARSDADKFGGGSEQGWDNLGIFGWLGNPSPVRSDFFGRDSILAAPVALDPPVMDGSPIPAWNTTIDDHL